MSGRPVWMVAPHLCGFSTAIAAQRLLVPMKVFIDESGKGDPVVFVMAGFIARAEQWAKFSDEWEAVLSEPPAVEAFHLAESRYSGAYIKLPKLIEIIEKYALTGIAITVPADSYQKHLSGKIGRRMDQPYVLIYFSMMILAAWWQMTQGLNEKMDFIFDEQNTESDFLQSIYSKAADLMPDELKCRMGGRPIHADDKKVLPLQAADILAGYVRRAYLDSPGPSVSLPSPLDRIPFVSWHMDDKRISELMQGVNARNRKNGMITEHQFSNAARYWDFLIQGFNVQQIEKAAAGKPIPLLAFPAKQMKRYILVHNCALCHTPHLHKRVANECLGEA